jgi:hypothetical protein
VVWALRGANGSLPWHRVVGAGGKILLRDHFAMEQRMRLEMEGVKFSGARVDMKECAWKVSGTKAKRPKKALGSKGMPRAKKRRSA